MHKVYLALLLIIIVIAIVIITLGITIKVTKNKECFTTAEIEQKLNIPSDKDIKDHENLKNIHDSNKNASVGDIIFMPNEKDKLITKYGCEYLRIRNDETYDFLRPKYSEFIDKFLDGNPGTYRIRFSNGAVGSSHEKTFKPDIDLRENKISFNRIGKDDVVEFKDAVITSDEILKSTAVAPYFFTRSQSSDIETPWLEKPMEIEADVDIKSMLPFGKVYLYVCILTKSK